MSVVKLILTITAAIGSANAASSRLVDVMSVATNYDGTQLHSNVTAYDVCMFIATGYQVIQRDTDKNISTLAYDDLDQGVARILTRYVNDEYDNTTEALDTYNTTQREENFDVSECDGITEDEVIAWYFPSTELSTDYDQDLDRGRREVLNAVPQDRIVCQVLESLIYLCAHTMVLLVVHRVVVSNTDRTQQHVKHHSNMVRCGLWKTIGVGVQLLL